MSYIFNFRYKPNTDLTTLNDFVKVKKLKWKSRNITLSGDITVKFSVSTSALDSLTDSLSKIKNSGVAIDSIECDNGSFITYENTNIIKV